MPRPLRGRICWTQNPRAKAHVRLERARNLIMPKQNNKWHVSIYVFYIARQCMNIRLRNISICICLHTWHDVIALRTDVQLCEYEGRHQNQPRLATPKTVLFFGLLEPGFRSRPLQCLGWQRLDFFLSLSLRVCPWLSVRLGRSVSLCVSLAFFQLRVVLCRISFNFWLVRAYCLSTLGCLGFFSFNPWLSRAEFLPAAGCLELTFSQPWGVWGVCSFNRGLPRADFCLALACLRRNLFQPLAV